MNPFSVSAEAFNLGMFGEAESASYYRGWNRQTCFPRLPHSWVTGIWLSRPTPRLWIELVPQRRRGGPGGCLCAGRLCEHGGSSSVTGLGAGVEFSSPDWFCSLVLFRATQFQVWFSGPYWEVWEVANERLTNSYSSSPRTFSVAYNEKPQYINNQ